jgi:hypothetical protein
LRPTPFSVNQKKGTGSRYFRQVINAISNLSADKYDDTIDTAASVI